MHRNAEKCAMCNVQCAMWNVQCEESEVFDKSETVGAGHY